MAEIFPDTCIIGKKNYFICTNASVKDWNICLTGLLFIGLSKKWDPRHGNLDGIPGPRLTTHLWGEIRYPRPETLNVRPKTWESHRVRDTSRRTAKWQTGIQNPEPSSEPNKGYCNKISKISFFWCRGPRFEFSGSRKICLNRSSELKTEGHRT